MSQSSLWQNTVLDTEKMCTNLTNSCLQVYP